MQYSCYKYTYSCRSMKKKAQVGYHFQQNNKNKDNTHKMQKMIILLKWTDFRYYFLLRSTRRGE